MTDEDQPSRKDEQVYWAPQTGPGQPGTGLGADQDADATAERPAVGHTGGGSPGQGNQHAGQEAPASAERSPQQYGGSGSSQPGEGVGPRVAAPAWPAYPPRPDGQGQFGQGQSGQYGQGSPAQGSPWSGQPGPGESGQYGQGQSGQYGQSQPTPGQYGQGQPVQYGQTQPGEQSQPGQGQLGQSQSAPDQYGQSRPAEGQAAQSQPTPDQYGPVQAGESQLGQSQVGQYGQSQPVEGQSGQGQLAPDQYGQGQSSQGQPAPDQYGPVQPGQSQPGQSQPGQGQPSQGQQQYSAYPPPPNSAGQTGWSSPSGPPTGPWPAALGDTRNQPNPQQLNNGQNSNGGSLVPGFQPPWGPPPPLPQGRANGRASGRASLIAAALGVGLLAGVLGGLGGSALYDDVSDSNGRAPTVSLPEPVRDNREQTAGEVTGVASAVTPSVVSLEVVAGQSQGTGSGFVVDAENGYILTNNHVVTGGSTGGDADIRVVFQDGTQAKGTLVGADASYDLAVVKVKAKGLRELTFGDSDDVQVGDPVVAIGAPLGLTGTVTTGIVSALNRPVAAGEGDTPAFINAIQTDAAINPGNSGGPLVNAAGHVIAVNSAIARVPGTTAETTGGSIGLGFAIPSNQAQRTAEQLIQTGKASHPIIGVTLDSTYNGEGVRVSQQPTAGQEPVTADGPADRAGVEAGDIITKFNGRPVTAPDELIVAIRAEKPGDTVTLTIRRNGGNEQDVKVKLDESSD